VILSQLAGGISLLILSIPEKEACDMLLFRKPELSEYLFQRTEIRKSGLNQIQPDKKRQRKPPW
jgi:hypothetical protein